MASAEQKFTIVAMTRVMSVNPARLGQWDRIIVYTTTNGHGASVFVPDENFTEDTARQSIKADIEDRNQWLGKSFRL